MRRLVPALKKASPAARVVITPAVSDSASTEPGSVDWGTPISRVSSERSTRRLSSSS